MKCFAQALDLKNDSKLIAEYKEWHTRVWPEVLDGLRELGIRNMRIFLMGTHLFMYYEAPDGFDPARDYQKYAQRPRVQEWDRLMRGYQQRVAEASQGTGEWWTGMECVFELEGREGRRGGGWRSSEQGTGNREQGTVNSEQ